MKAKIITKLVLIPSITAVLFILSNSNVYAQQEDKPLRVEINAELSDSYHIITLGEKGLLLFYKNIKDSKQPENKWRFYLYDSEFRYVHSCDVNISNIYEYSKYDKNDDFVYLYFENFHGKVDPLKVCILKINTESLSINIFQNSIKGRYNITEFGITGDKAVIAGRSLPGKGRAILQTAFTFTLIPAFTGATFLKFKPAVFLYDFNTKDIKGLDLSYQGQSWVESLNILKDSIHSFDLVTRNFVPKKYNAINISKVDEKGQIIQNINFQPVVANKKCITANILSTQQKGNIIVGTYNNLVKGKRANPAFSGFTEKANGIFFSRFFNDSILFTRFYNFSDFVNFYSNAYSLNVQHVNKKILRKKQKGKEVVFDYNLLFHDVIVKDDKYIVIAEAYYPEYHTVYYTTYYRGYMMTNSYDVFDGYRYTSALIACFNNDGELLWDNSLKIWDVLTYNLSERVKVLFDKEDIVLAYSNEGEITSSVIRDNIVVGGRESFRIETGSQDDKLLKDYNSGLEYWYGNYYLSYGYQKIKNIQEEKKQRRTVFYLNKIAFR